MGKTCLHPAAARAQASEQAAKKENPLVKINVCLFKFEMSYSAKVMAAASPHDCFLVVLNF
jgi:hypothetical protein